MRTRPLISALIALALVCRFAGADTVKLKSGDTIQGTITAEDSTSVSIEFEFAKGIKDERRIEKTEIESFSKDDPADKAWEELTKEIPTADLMSVSDYDILSAKVEKFIANHGKSTRAAEARRLLTSLKEERALVAAGGMKLDGGWISHEQYQREKYWVDGRIAFKEMCDLGKSGRKLEALRVFEKIETSYAGTTIHAKAITEGTLLLKQYGASLTEAIRNHPSYMSQRAKVLSSLIPEERQKTENLQQAEVAAHKAKIEAERKTGTKWLTMATFDLEELKKAVDLVDKEGKRLATLDTSNAVATDATLRQVDQAIHEGRINAATALLSQISKMSQSVPYIKELQVRVQSAVDRAAAEKKAADDARAAAERAEREANPPPATPRETDEPDPVKEGMNPVVKAVAESDLGKLVAGETKGPEPKEPVPAPAVTEPDSPTAATETSTTESEKSETGTKTTTGGSFTPILYITAGVLVLILVILLLLPSLTKKPAEEPGMPGHPKQSTPEAEDLQDENPDDRA